MSDSSVVAQRPIYLTREGSVFRLSFVFNPQLVDLMRTLPYAKFDGESKTWTCTVATQAVEALRRMFREGLTDVSVDSLIEAGEAIPTCRPAVLRPNTLRRPYLVLTAFRDDSLYSKLRSVPSAQWEKGPQGVSYGSMASTALAELVSRGVLDDPDRILSPADTVVAFDGRTGKFAVRGDARAAAAFEKNFPKVDVVKAWQERSLDVAFADPFSEEVYRGELARVGPGFQPEGLLTELFPYQRESVAIALERTGLGVFAAPGLGKCVLPGTRVWVDGTQRNIEDIWESHGLSAYPSPDGLGEWAELAAPLTVNSVDEKGRNVKGRVARLFRQEITETVRRVRLDDGSSISMTRAHRLLGPSGWTNEFQVGDWVAVADGQPTQSEELKQLWAEIVSVEEFEYAGPVYDLEVDEYHNYVAEGIFCHNTVIAIATGFECLNRGEVSRCVIVVPGAVRSQWRNEIMRFTGCGPEDVAVVAGDKKKRAAAYAQAADAKWLVVHYDVLHLDYKAIAPLVAGSFITLDEAHRCKSPTAKRTKAARMLSGKAARRMALTGTPVENDPGEWYSVLSGLAVPGCLGSVTDFFSRYTYPNAWGGYEGARNLGELRERSRCHYVRYTKAEVATHLPPLRVQHLPLDPDTSLTSALKRAHRDARDEIAKDAVDRVTAGGRRMVDEETTDNLESGAGMTAIGMLRMMCSSPRLLHRSESPAARALCESGLVPDVDGPKLDELRVMATEMQAAGERLVVFTFSKKMAYLIGERLTEDGIRHVLFTGDSSNDERDAAAAAFTTAPTEDDPGPTVFVATDAGAEGLNLGKQCSTLVNFDIPWTSSRMVQRGNRIHRIDGTAPRYLVINLTLRGTLEAQLLTMVERKADLSDAIFGEDEGRAMSTGRTGGKSFFEEAMEAWESDPPTK